MERTAVYENESWVRLSRLPLGARIYAIKHMRREAVALGSPPDFIAELDACIETDRQRLARFKSYINSQAQATSGSWTEEILDLDRKVDPLVIDLRDTLEVNSRRTHTAKGQAAAHLLSQHFAMPASWYTNAPIEQGVERVGLLLTQINADAALVERAGVADIVAEMAPLHQALAEAVNAHQKLKPLAFESIRQDELAGHRALLGLVIEVLANTRRLPGDEGLARRERLLSEVVAQNRAVTAALRARRRVVDIDPDSGVPEA